MGSLLTNVDLRLIIRNDRKTHDTTKLNGGVLVVASQPSNWFDYSDVAISMIRQPLLGKEKIVNERAISKAIRQKHPPLRP